MSSVILTIDGIEVYNNSLPPSEDPPPIPPSTPPPSRPPKYLTPKPTIYQFTSGGKSRRRKLRKTRRRSYRRKF